MLRNRVVQLVSSISIACLIIHLKQLCMSFRTIYCMNEKELVEAAVAFISHDGAGDCDTSHHEHQVAPFYSKASCMHQMYHAMLQSTTQFMYLHFAIVLPLMIG